MKSIVETARNLKNCLYEHKHEIILANSNVIFLHISKTRHNFNFNAATM